MTWTIIQADAHHIPLADQSVQCVVSSPPYWGLRDYGQEGQIGLEKTPEEYVAKIVAVFREVWRVLRDDGTVFCNLGDSYAGHNLPGWRDGNEIKNGGVSNKNGVGYVPGLKPKDLVGIPWRIAFALQAAGWYLRSDIIWSKPNPMPESVTDRPTKAHEYIFLLSKKERYFFDQDAVREAASENTHAWYSQANGQKTIAQANEQGVRPSIFAGYMPPCRNIRTVWEIATQPYPEAHFATFPEEIAIRCIKAGTSEKGACAKCGSPWERMTETTRTKDPTRHTGRAAVGCDDRQDGDWPRMLIENKTIGWQPTCKCARRSALVTPYVLPCVVLDPFSGAGTVPLVADKLNRRGIGLELKADYCRMAERRCYDDAPLLALNY